MAENLRTREWDLLLRVTGLESKERADAFAEAMAQWLTEHGGGEYFRYQ